MLKISVTNRAAFCCSDKDPITTGSVGYPVEFLFSDDWNGLQKIAVFRGSGLAFDVPLINTDSTVIPHEVLTQAGKSLLIGVYGANGDGDVVIPTVYANAGIILPGAEPSEVDPSIPTPSWAIQVQEAAENTLSRAQESADAAAADAQDAAASAVLAESWAAGDTGSRAGEDTNNSKYWAEVAQQGAEHSGYAIFDVNDQDGQMYVTITDPLSQDVSFLVNETSGELEVTIHG